MIEVKSQARLAAEMVVGGFWRSQVRRVAEHALERGAAVTLWPPTAEDYDRAEGILAALLTKPETALAIAEPESEDLLREAKS